VTFGNINLFSTMKHLLLLALLLASMASLKSQETYVVQGDPDQSLAAYGAKLFQQPKGKQKETDLRRFEAAYRLAHEQDSKALEQLDAQQSPENWPRINALHRQIEARQQLLAALQPLSSKKGYTPELPAIESIKTLQATSRWKAADYLYNRAKNLLAPSDDALRQQAAQQAYYTLFELKTNYFEFWEDADALMETARQSGMVHVLLQTNEHELEEEALLIRQFMGLGNADESYGWFAFHTSELARPGFDYRVRCTLKQLDASPLNMSKGRLTETQLVGYSYPFGFEMMPGDLPSNSLVARAVRKHKTTYQYSRAASGILSVELFNERTGSIQVEQLERQSSFKVRTIENTALVPDEMAMISSLAEEFKEALVELLHERLLR